ncbi:MAG: C40 family peptidase [Thermoanaerobaculia bacterium]
MSTLRTGLVVVSLGLATGCGSAPSVPPAPTPGRTDPASVPRSIATTAPESVVRIARSLLATPYRYGGSDPRGFDCSGLTSFVFRRVGLSLPRTAQSQASSGRWIPPDELSRGDLVFFGDQRHKPLHVGVVVSRPGEPLTMIHSSSTHGVVETEVLTDSYWLARLKFGRRVLE